MTGWRSKLYANERYVCHHTDKAILKDLNIPSLLDNSL